MRARYWQLLLAVFFLGWIFMYADRTVLSPVLSEIGGEWHLDTGQLGLISSLFFLAYAAMQVPTGWLAERFGRKRILVPGYLLFGVMTALGAFAPSYGIFLVLGALSGLGQGTYYATQFSLSSEAIPRRARGFGSAIINSGQAFGISLGFVLSPFVAFTLGDGWRASYGVLGVLTVLAGLVLWRFVREHAPTEDVATEKGATPDAGHPGTIAAADRTATSQHASIFTRDLVLAYITMFCSLYGFFVILTWLPYYLQQARGMAPSQTGIISSLVPWASIPGALALSALSDRLQARRGLALVLLLLAAVAMLLIPLLPGLGLLYLVLVGYGLVGKLALDPIMVAFVADRVPARRYSSAFAFFNLAGMSSSILAPYITGVLRDRLGTLEVGFYLAAGLLVVGALCMALTRRETRARAPFVEPVDTAEVMPGAIDA